MQIGRKTVRRRNLLLLLVALALSVGALVYAVNWWLYGRFWVVTNNAFVTGNLIPVRSIMKKPNQ
jgi:membrane fusion protein (multidrug efflux system)